MSQGQSAPGQGAPALVSGVTTAANKPVIPAFDGIDIVHDVEDLLDVIRRLEAIQRLHLSERQRLGAAVDRHEILDAWSFATDLTAPLLADLASVQQRIRQRARVTALVVDRYKEQHASDTHTT